MIITRKNPFNNQIITREINCTQEQYDAWRSGELIQKAMPNVSSYDREFILTGITDEQWDELFEEK